jgi:hypothetical protein
MRGVQSSVAEEAQLGSVNWTLEGSHDRTLGKHYSRVRSWWLGTLKVLCLMLVISDNA